MIMVDEYLEGHIQIPAAVQGHFKPESRGRQARQLTLSSLLSFRFLHHIERCAE